MVVDLDKGSFRVVMWWDPREGGNGTRRRNRGLTGVWWGADGELGRGPARVRSFTPPS